MGLIRAHDATINRRLLAAGCHFSGSVECRVSSFECEDILGRRSRHAFNSKLETRNSKLAFTLVELVIVLVVIAVAAAIVGPRYAQAIQRYRADSAARQVVHQFDYAARRARAAGRTLTLAVNTGDSTLTWTDPNGAVVNRLALGDEPFRAKVASTAHAGGGSLQISGLGVPCGDTSVVLTVGAQTRTVSFDAETSEAVWE